MGVDPNPNGNVALCGFRWSFAPSHRHVGFVARNKLSRRPMLDEKYSGSNPTWTEWGEVNYSAEYEYIKSNRFTVNPC